MLQTIKNQDTKIWFLLAILVSFFSVRAITPNFHTWSTTASDAGIYLAFIPNFWVAHPGGATVYTSIGWIWSNAFLAFGINPNFSLLLLNNLLASLTAALAFWWGIKKGLNPFYSFFAALSVIISAIAFTQFAVIESYPMHGVLLLLFFISWDYRRTNWQILFGGLAAGSHHTLLLIVGLTYLIGMFLGDRKQYSAMIGTGLITLGLYSTIVFRALMGWTFDAQIDNTWASISHYFRALTPILQLYIFDIPPRLVAYLPIVIVSFMFSLILIGLSVFAPYKRPSFNPVRLYIILSVVYLFYILFYISMQGYRYFHLLPIILLPIVIYSLLHLQSSSIPKISHILITASFPFFLIMLVSIQAIHLYPNNDMEKMRTELYRIREIAREKGQQQIIFTQYYNEVIGTYWNEVFNYGFLDTTLEGRHLGYDVSLVNEWGGMKLGWENDARVAAMYSDNSPVLVIPSIYTLQSNRISLRYQELIKQNTPEGNPAFTIQPCLSENPDFIPFETYYCVAEQGLKSLQGNENVWYASVNPYDTLGEKYEFPTYITKQDQTSYINIEGAGYFSRWTDVLWPGTISGRPYWAAFIRGDFEHPYWDSDNWNPYFTVMFIGFWGFIVGFILLWGWKSFRNKRIIRMEEVFVK